MIRIALLVIIAIFIVFQCTRQYTEEPAEAKSTYSDIPTPEEQQALEKEQPVPEALSESDMEDFSPEDAENN